MRTLIASAILLYLFANSSAAAPTLATATPLSVPMATLKGQPHDPSQNNGTEEQGDLKTFTGKIVSLNGSLFILRDDVNQVWYHLDDQATARKFVGRNVNVKGKLDTRTDVIHVQSIEVQEQKNSILANPPRD